MNVVNVAATSAAVTASQGGAFESPGGTLVLSFIVLCIIGICFNAIEDDEFGGLHIFLGIVWISALACFIDAVKYFH